MDGWSKESRNEGRIENVNIEKRGKEKRKEWMKESKKKRGRKEKIKKIKNQG